METENAMNNTTTATTAGPSTTLPPVKRRRPGRQTGWRRAKSRSAQPAPGTTAATATLTTPHVSTPKRHLSLQREANGLWTLHVSFNSLSEAQRYVEEGHKLM